MAAWEEIASSLRGRIERGEYQPGALIPKESELRELYGVGRQTIRQAVGQLVAEGLLDPRRRRGTVVREHPPRERIVRSRVVHRDEIGYYFDEAARSWRALRAPEVSRGPAPYDVAGLLGLPPGTEVVIRDRLMGDPATGEPNQIATSFIPAALAADLPVLEEPDPGPGGIYDRMEEAGYGPIRWSEAISTRMPSPAETAALRLPNGVPVLRIVRLAESPTGRPLEVNDTRMDGERWEVGYPITRDASAQPVE